MLFYIFFPRSYLLDYLSLFYTLYQMNGHQVFANVDKSQFGSESWLIEKNQIKRIQFKKKYTQK